MKYFYAFFYIYSSFFINKKERYRITSIKRRERLLNFSIFRGGGGGGGGVYSRGAFNRGGRLIEGGGGVYKILAIFSSYKI